MKKQLLLIACVSLLPLASAFADDQEEDFKKVQDLSDEVNALNKDISCKEASDCVAIPFGHRPCGGPADYIVASKKNKKLSLLEAKAEEYTMAQTKYQQEYEGDVMSICSILNPPAMECSRKQCAKAK